MRHAAYYTSCVEACDAELKRLDARFTRCSWLRAGAALFVLVFFFVAIQWNGYIGWPLTLAGVVAFLLLMRRHDAIERLQQYQAARRAAAVAYLARGGEDWKTFAHNGREYLTEDFPAGKDLDLFGRESLYQFLCTAQTQGGRDRLATLLREGCPTADIPARQRAVEELANKPEFTLKLQSLGRQLSLASKTDGEALAAFLEILRRNDTLPRILAVLMWGLPFLTLFFLLSAILGVAPSLNLGIAIALLLLQLIIALARFPASSRILTPLCRFQQGIAPYAALMELIEKEEFASDCLRTLQEAMRRRGGALNGLHTLRRIADAAQARHNLLAFLLGNSLLQWDSHCIARFCAWRDAYREDIPAWFEALGEIEALSSLSVLCRTRDVFCFPQVEETATPQLSFQDLRHPLIAEEKAVGNDFLLTHRTCIITGSNMSGKTTFLRCIGVNLTLAYAGGPVLARAFRTTRMRLLTSMRVEDSVSLGISSFYAELLRIKTIVDASREGKPLIALIDEIYKGTNSRDRILGAVETVRRLSSPQTMTLVTTHDFELCELEKDPVADAVNYHFAEQYTQEEILFDYRLRPGRCTTTNAQQLLRLVGIL